MKLFLLILIPILLIDIQSTGAHWFGGKTLFHKQAPVAPVHYYAQPTHFVHQPIVYQRPVFHRQAQFVHRPVVHHAQFIQQPMVHHQAQFVHAPVVHHAQFVQQPVFHHQAQFVHQMPVQHHQVMAPIGDGGGTMRVMTRLLSWVMDNKPQLLPIVTDIAIDNPHLLRMVLGGITKRDTSSQLEAKNKTESKPIDPILVRRMFEYVLDNDNDDCFKKYICGFAKNALKFDASNPEVDLELLATEHNEPISPVRECETRFAKCAFKEFKIRDTELFGSHLRQKSDNSDNGFDEK